MDRGQEEPSLPSDMVHKSEQNTERATTESRKKQKKM